MVNLVQVMAPNDPRQQIADALSAQQLPQLPQLQGGSPMPQGQQGGGLNNDIYTIARKLFNGGQGAGTPDVGSGGAAAGAGYGPESAAAGAGADVAGATTPTLGLDATGAAADTAAYSPAAIDATSGAEAGTGLGAAGAAAGIALPVALALTSQPYEENADWWKRLGTSLTSGTSGNATYDQYDSPGYQEYNAKNSLYSMLQRGPTENLLGQSGPGIPQGILDMAQGYGMINKDGSLNKNWSAGAEPLADAVGARASGGADGRVL